MTDQEHEKRDETTSDEREETLKDLDIPEEDGTGVTGGAAIKEGHPEKL